MDLTKIKSLEWKKEPFCKQNWGNNFHSISSYVGRIKPSFAHWLIESVSKKGDVVYDPFCGIGTVPLEASIMGRKSIGNDLNPYAYSITKSKLDNRGIEKELDYLKEIDLKKSEKINLNSVEGWVKEYYHPNTLKEILYLVDEFKKDNRHFLLGCLLGISHGHRPQHLSMRTGYIIPYIPNPKPEIVYKNSIEKLIQKVNRMYKSQPFFEYSPEVFLGDSRATPFINDKSIDVVVSSPPYYDTLDYVSANKLRLYLYGINDNSQNELKSNLIQDKKNYLDEMLKIGEEINRVLKDEGVIVFVLGDVHYGKRTVNTALDISKLYQDSKLFKTIYIIDDKIPPEKTTIIKYGGNQAISSKKEKLDRILILKKQ